MPEKLSEILTALKKDRLPEELLGQIEIDDGRKKLLRGFVRAGLLDFPDKRTHRINIGAAIFLSGVLAFKEAPANTTWTYSTVQDWLDPKGTRLSNLDFGAAIARFYDFIEEGAQKWWNITLRHGRTGIRLFQGTMLIHSGAGDALVVDILSECSDHLGGWDEMASADLMRLAQRISQLPLQGYQKTALSSDDTLIAVTERLQEIAIARHTMIDMGIVTSTTEITLNSLTEAGLRHIFDIAKTDLLLKLLGILFPSQAIGVEPILPVFRWCWSLTGTRPGMAIEVPNMLPSTLFPSADRVALRCSDGSDRIFYRLEGNHFVRESAKTRLSVDRDPPVIIMGISRIQTKTLEQELKPILEFPSNGFALFLAENGAFIRTAPAGTNVVLVAEPGQDINPPKGFIQTGKGWLGSMPADAVNLADGIILSPSEKRLAIDLQLGMHVPGLLLDGAKVYRHMPRIYVYGVDRGAGCLQLPDGSKIEIPLSRFRLGRVPVPVQQQSGRYRLEVHYAGRSGTISFFLLPESLCNLKIRNVVGSAELHAPGSAQTTFSYESLVGIGTLKLPVEHYINRKITIQIAKWKGVWYIPACGLNVKIQRGPDGEFLPNPSVANPIDIRILQGGAGLRVYGTPHRDVEITINERIVSYTFGSSGSVYAPFTDLLLSLPEGELIIKVRWGTKEQTLGPFVNEADARPELFMDNDIFRIQLRSRAQNVHMKAVPAWAPWEPARYLPAECVELEGKVWYEAQRADTTGPIHARLVERQQQEDGERWIPLTGMRLVGYNGICPQTFAPLEQALWHDTPDKLKLLGARILLDETGDLLRGLIDRIMEDGARWFKVVDIFNAERGSTLMGVSINSWRLQTSLVQREGEKDRKRLDWLYSHGPSLIWLHIADMKRIFKRVHSSAIQDRIEPLLYQTGLLIPTFRLLDPQWNPAIHISKQPDWVRSFICYQLRSKEYESLTQPGDRTPNDQDPPRFAGLLEAHLYLQVNPEFIWYQNLAQNLPQYRYQMENQIPTRERAIEAEIIERTAIIHAWRCGQNQPMTEQPYWLKRTLLLHEKFPRLFDFWLNYHAIREFP